MPQRVRVFIPAVVGPLLLLSAFLTAGFALVRLHPDAPAESSPVRLPAAPAVVRPATTAEPSPQAVSSLRLDVNYAHDWVGGATDPGASVVITLTNEASAFKAAATVEADAGGGFITTCGDWTPQCPDIRTGDHAFASTGGALASIDPIGRLDGRPDAATEIVSGELHANWFEGPLVVLCEIWEAGPTLVITDTVTTNGGPFFCGFEGSWNLEPPQMVAVRYLEPDGDSVINVLQWPWMRVNYHHDWVGANFEAGHTLWLTATDSGGAVKATATVQSQPGGGWDFDGFETPPDVWTPAQPDLQPGDFIYLSADDGYTDTLEIGTIDGWLDVAADQISGTIVVPGAPITTPIPIECHPWGAWAAGLIAPVKFDAALPTGSDVFDCTWDPASEWDIEGGQDLAVMYIQPDLDRVIDVYREPAPHLRIETGAQGAPGENGHQVLTVSYWNFGDAPAESVVVTDTLSPGMAYLADTSGFPRSGSGGGPIVWDLGTVDPGAAGAFDLYVEITGVASQAITNTVEISTTTPFDQGEPGEKYAFLPQTVQPNDTHLSVSKTAWTDDPAPGQKVVFALNVCNIGATDSATVTLEDTLHPALNLSRWWTENLGWNEVSSDPRHLTVAILAIPAFACSEVFLEAEVAPGLAVGDRLANYVRISSPNDLSPHDNEALWEAFAAPARRNLRVEKRWSRGQLVPGGEIVYDIGYANTGNVPVSSYTLTDTFPSGTTYVGAWVHDPDGSYPLPPTVVTDDYAAWEFSDELVNGAFKGFELRLAIDSSTPPGTDLVNEATISPLPQEETVADNFAVWSETVRSNGPNLRVAKRHTWRDTAGLDYEVQFENVGDQAASDPRITDTLPLETIWNGDWRMEFDWDRHVDFNHTGGVMTWDLSEILPGESGWLYFGADLDTPGTPLRWYTNTVEVSLPAGETDPYDNFSEDVALSGGEVRRVELWLPPGLPSRLWGSAVSGPVTVTTPITENVVWADAACGGCWHLENAGLLEPGDPVVVAAGEGTLPITITLPDPLTAEVDTDGDTVFGQIGGWSERPVEIEGGWPESRRSVTTDGAGNFLATYADIPAGGSGLIRFIDEINYAEVVFSRPYRALDLVLDINYGYDSVEGFYEPGHTVWITATESDGSTVKGTAQLDTAYLPGWADPGFSTTVGGWQAAEPDLQPGDWVFAAVDNGHSGQAQIGDIDFVVDADSDVISGTLTADWWSDPLPTRCEIWTDGGTLAIDLLVDPAGGQILCDFGAQGWEVARGPTAGVMYREPDQHRLRTQFDWPRAIAGIGPESGGNRYLWGHHAEPDAAVTVTVTTEAGAFVAGASAATDADGDWETGNSLPPGTLAEWNRILIDFGNTITDTLTVHPVLGEADASSDVVTVTVDGPPAYTVEVQICHPVKGCDWFGLGEIGDDGIASSDLASEHGYDLLLGSSLAAFLNLANGHQLRYAWGTPAPELAVSKWNTSGGSRPGGKAIYRIEYSNYGSGTAESTLLVDTLPSLTTYADDTSGLPVTIGAGGVITWDVGTFDPEKDSSFAVTLDVDSAIPITVAELGANCVGVETATPGDWNPENNESCSGSVEILDDVVDLSVEKWAMPNDPTPGEELDYAITWCNKRSTAAGPAVITDTLPAETNLLGWRQDSHEPFWTEMSATGDELVLYAPSLPGEACRTFYLRAVLEPGTAIGTTLENSVELAVAGDVLPDDNWYLHNSARAGEPRLDLALAKRLSGSVLIPGGRATFLIDYGNEGNFASSAHITDTLPIGFTYVGGWWTAGEPAAGEPIPDPVIVGNQLVWDLPALGVSRRGGFEIELEIDDSVPVGQELVNCAEIAGDGSDAQPGNNISCVDFQLQPAGPNLSIGKTHRWSGEGRLDYTVTFANHGVTPVESVLLTDTLPVDTQWSGAWFTDFAEGRLVEQSVGADRLVWSLDVLHPGEWGNIFFAADLDAPGEPARWYTNTVEITLPPDDTRPEDNLYEDVAFSGSGPRVDLEKFTNGVDADEYPGPMITVGTPITWTYVVHNAGTVALFDLEVTDSRGVELTCEPLGELAPGASLSCTGFGVAEEGPYFNIGSVVAHPAIGAPVEDVDVSHYVGGEPIFVDGFESGDTSKWDSEEPPP